MKFPFPLRYSVPGNLLLLGLILIGVSIYHNVRDAERLVEEQMHYAAESLGNHLASNLERDLGRGDVTDAELALSLSITEPHLRTSLVFDESNRVLYASDYDWRGRSMAGTAPQTLSTLAAQAREKMSGQLQLSSDRRTLIAVFPFHLGLLAGELRASRVAVLYLEYDLEEQRRANLVKAVNDSLLMGSVVIAVCVLAWWYFDRSLTRRVSLLVAATRELAAGKLAARAHLRGGDELASLAGSFNSMAEQIQSNMSAVEEANAAFRESETRLRQATGAARIGTWDFDILNNRMTGDESAERLLGVAPGQLVGTPDDFLALVLREDQPACREIFTRTIETGVPFVSEFRIWRPGGHVRWVASQGELFRDEDGQPLHMRGVVWDVTERHEMEERLRRAQKLESVGQLAGGLAHDFNNILTALIMRADVARGTENTPAEVQLALLEIRAAAARVADLTRQLLIFSGQQVIQSRRLDLNEVVTSLASTLGSIVGEDVCVQLSLSPTPLFTQADPAMLNQVLTVFATNSRDAMPKGGRLVIETSQRTIDADEARRVQEAAPGRYVCLSVSDTGCGIPSENLPHIFDPFFTTKEMGEEKGTGLGLATVFGIVKLHHGWLEVDSETGQGATFRILLPASDTPAEPLAGQVAKIEPRGITETILLVDDESAVRMVIRGVLELEGYNVVEAASGVDAQRVRREHAQRVDLLLTDLVMPGGVDGLELAAHLLDQEPGLKVVFMSGYNTGIAGRELKLPAGQYFLHKPFSADRLLDTIRKCLDG